jgi:hypothetical protein
LLVKASRALERKRYERAVELAFRGYKRWLRRAGGRAGRIRGYREILHATVDRGKGKVVLNRCQRAKSAFEDRACERFLLEHLKRGAAVEEGREKAIGLFCAACLDKKAILSHFKDVCAQLPAGLALSEPLRAKLDELLQTRCASKDLKRAESALCKRVGFIFWKHARASGDHRRLASLVPALLRLAPSATWKRLLTDLADDSLPKSARLVFEGVFLRQAGGSGEARALAEVFLERLEPGERRSLIRRYLTVAKGKVPEAASVLAQVDFSTALEVIKEIAKSDVKGAGALAEKLSNRVSSSPLAVLREYVSIRRESSDLRKKALSLLAAHPDVVYQHVVSRIASTPLPQRNRLRRLTGELRPKALYGEVKGKLIKKKAHLMTVPCKVQLVELSSCDVREPVGPDRAGKARGRGKGAGVRIKRTVEVDENRKYRFERLPVAPYEMFVWCPDGLGWRRVRFGGFEIGEDGKPVWKGRCMVTSAPLKVVRALPVHLDRPWRLDHPPPVNSSSKHGGGSGRVKPKLPPKRAAPLF